MTGKTHYPRPTFFNRGNTSAAIVYRPNTPIPTAPPMPKYAATMVTKTGRSVSHIQYPILFSDAAISSVRTKATNPDTMAPRTTDRLKRDWEYLVTLANTAKPANKGGKYEARSSEL